MINEYMKYKVNDVKNVNEFCNKYYNKDKEYLNNFIQLKERELKENGFCVISYHDSITEQCVTFFNNKNKG
jgi:hypothetical protein